MEEVAGTSGRSLRFVFRLGGSRGWVAGNTAIDCRALPAEKTTSQFGSGNGAGGGP